MTDTAIRDVCLLPFDNGWQHPTGEEIKQVLRLANLSGSKAAKLTGIKESRTVRRWTGGESEIPFAAWAILCEVAGLGMIWKER